MSSRDKTEAAQAAPEGANYVGVKNVQAWPETLGEYNKRRGWEIPKDEDPNRLGYGIQYPDGYNSWSPKEQFEEAYTLIPGDCVYSVANVVETARSKVTALASQFASADQVQGEAQ
jgi:hypothetical protein